MKTLKITYKNGNEIMQKNVNDYEITDKLYMSIYNGLSNVWLILKLECIKDIKEV